MRAAVLDASVAIGLLDAQDAHHEAAWREPHALVDAGALIVLPVTAYAEVLVGVLRGGAQSEQIFTMFCTELVGEIAPATEDTAVIAARLRHRHAGLRLLDSLVIAAGEELGAEVLTAERRWRGYSDRVRVV